MRYTTVNKFEGKSSYFSYYPTTDLKEQKLEQVWFHHKNKQLADKRCNEETAAYLREWAQARGRMEAEIQRRKEHLNEATNFEKARGFVRTNWKTKNWNPNNDPTQEDSSTDSDEEETTYKEETRDKVPVDIQSPNSKALDSEERDNMNYSEQDMMNNSSSLNMPMQTSDKKSHKRLYMQKPLVVDVAETQSEKSTMQSVTELQDTQNAICAYNNALKPARKKKDALPEITSNNLTMRDRFVKEPKKGKVVREFRFMKVGNLDEGHVENPNDDVYSISAK